jgi:tetratricopeptide (TPR) repeat protein
MAAVAVVAMLVLAGGAAAALKLRARHRARVEAATKVALPVREPAPPPPAPSRAATPSPPPAAPPSTKAPAAALAVAPVPAPAPPPRPVERIVEEAPEAPPPRLSVSAYWYEGSEGYQRALAEQRSAHAPALVYFRVDWCPYCRKLDREVLPTSPVERFLRDVIKVRINPEKSPADEALARSFDVHGYPSVFVIPGPDAKPDKVRAFTREGKEDITVTAERFVAECEKVGLRQARNLVADGAEKERAGDFAGARADLSRAIELDPNNAQAYYWRGRAAARAGEKGKAVGDLKRAIELDAKNPYAYVDLAATYGRAGQEDAAIATLGQLADAAPDWDHGAAFVMRGKAFARKGDQERATADFRQACQHGNAEACRAAGP